MGLFLVIYASIIYAVWRYFESRQHDWGIVTKGLYWIAGLSLGLLVAYNVAGLIDALLSRFLGGYG